ncbi:MAG: primosomal protein N' [Candidatus Bipolaricaulis sp.]|nr:primosomal protein N' [Candidatus Bipolaricaulis sp.]
MIVAVALPIPVDTAFDFALADGRPPEAVVGRRVRVRFSGTDLWGIAIAARPEDAAASLEPVLEVAPPPAYPPDLLEFCAAVCRDVCAPLGLLLNRTLPRATRRSPAPRRIALAAPLSDVLAYAERMQRRAPRQVAALRSLLAATGAVAETDLALPRRSVDRLIETGWVAAADSAPVARSEAPWPEEWPRRGRALLTAEDRMAEYGRLLDAVAADGRQALILAPEILLAHRLYRRLAHGRSEGALYHSGLSDGARGAVWERAAAGSLPWVIGTRSAVFLPFRDLALIVVDEEQDSSHKQADRLPYFHARRAAELRMQNGLLVLGSAAPSAETAHAVRRGEVVRAPTRETTRARSWEFVPPESPGRPLTEDLVSRIGRVLEAGRRVVIGVPRRGYFPAVLCRACRRPIRCDVCGTNLSVGERGRGAACPVCGRAPAVARCGHCASTDVAFVGYGTLRIEDELRAHAPKASILRVDADAVETGSPTDAFLERLEETADIVLGTAMLAKGPSLARVGLVIVLDVDRRLAVPDFRARERTLQYLTSIAALGGEAPVVVVTQSPDRSVFRFVQSGDYEGFLDSELADREAFSYPPYGHLARVVLTRNDRGRREADGIRLRQEVAEASVSVLGPARDAKDARRAVFLLKAERREFLLAACGRLRASGLPVQVDVDPDRP